MGAPNLKAKLVPFSSVVGQSVALHDEAGAVVALVMISVPSPSRDYRSTAEPIANLIAAAPEMLAELKRVLETLQAVGDFPSMQKGVRTSIARAEGRTP